MFEDLSFFFITDDFNYIFIKTWRRDSMHWILVIARLPSYLIRKVKIGQYKGKDDTECKRWNDSIICEKEEHVYYISFNLARNDILYRNFSTKGKKRN